MVASETIDACLERYQKDRFLLENFCNSVRDVFLKNPDFQGEPPLIHSVRSRLKEPGHLRDKLSRKHADGKLIEPGALYEEITDLAGVRVLHLYQEQFSGIHAGIQKHLDRNEWTLNEKPVAYTWDPDAREFFEKLGLDTTLKESHYTSVHYVVKPKPDSSWCCEIQIRTLFEEIWGEVDHLLNYPHPTSSLACKEQIRVLAKLVGAGSRLADAIFRTHSDETK